MMMTSKEEDKERHFWMGSHHLNLLTTQETESSGEA